MFATRTTEFVQTGTHWTTAVSFMNYIATVVWPHIQAAREKRLKEAIDALLVKEKTLSNIQTLEWERSEKKWIVLVAVAPIHVCV